MKTWKAPKAEKLYPEVLFWPGFREVLPEEVLGSFIKLTDRAESF